MAFCTNCGKQIEATSKFCPYCGEPQASFTPPVTPVAEPAAEPVAEEATPIVEEAASVVEPVTEPVDSSWESIPSMPEETVIPEQPVFQGQPTPAGQPFNQGQPTPAGQPFNQGQPTPAGQPFNQGQPTPAGQPFNQGQPTPAGQPYNQGQGVKPGQPVYGMPAGSVPYGAVPPAKTPKKKTGAGIFIAIGVVVAVIIGVLIALFSGGKSKASTDPNAGIYHAQVASMSGIDVNVEDIYSGGFYFELKDKGKCEIHVGDDSASGKWTLDGDTLNINGGGVELTGTLEDGVYTVDNAMGMGVKLVFVKEGTAIPDSGSTTTTTTEEPEDPEPVEEPASASSFVGIWDVTEAEYQGTRIPITDVYDGEVYIEFREDGTCSFTADGESADGDWEEKDGKVIVDGDETFSIEMKDGKMAMTIDDVIMYLEKR